jgi:hypothetical protein
MLAVVATACSKSKGSGGAAPVATPVNNNNYYLQNNVCYDRTTNQTVANTYCAGYNNGGNYANACTGFVFYTGFYNGNPVYVDVVDCRNNALYVECRDPHAYIRANEVVRCEAANYNVNGQY